MTITFKINEGKDAVGQAERELTSVIKQGIREALTEIFTDPDVQNVSFGVCTEPYNDENPGQGIFGPMVNMVDDEGDFTHDDEYELLYNYGPGHSDPRARLLKDVLDAAGWEYASAALGMSYDGAGGYGSDDNTVFVAARDDSVAGFSLTSHEIGY